jgi:hypothetical protein
MQEVQVTMPDIQEAMDSNPQFQLVVKNIALARRVRELEAALAAVQPIEEQDQ